MTEDGDTEQLTVRALIERLQQLVAEQTAIADMPVDLADCGVCGCGKSAPLFDVSVGPGALELGDDGSHWPQCACGHEVGDHRAPGAGCRRDDCLCSRFEPR